MKALKIKAGDTVAEVSLAGKVSKEDLYGDVVTLIEKEGKRLEFGYLTPEGKLLRRSQVANVGVDPEGTAVDLPSVLFDEQPAILQESAFDRELALMEVPLTRLVDLAVNDVYPVDGGGLKRGLYETSFNYRKSYLPKDALLLVKENGAFLLVGQFKRTQFVGQNQAYEFFDVPADEAEEDPMDFSMM